MLFSRKTLCRDVRILDVLQHTVHVRVDPGKYKLQNDTKARALQKVSFSVLLELWCFTI